jgi:hypothetical protein
LSLVAWVTLGRIGLGFILPSLNLNPAAAADSLLSQRLSAIFLRMGGAIGVSLLPTHC